MGEFETVIGLEVHCQLATNTKIFCSCPAGVSEDVNSHVCPVCSGHPGTLPVLNKKVLEYAIRAGLATNSQIKLKNTFSRKNYFYPDLPKGYQISQYDEPICQHGYLEIETKAGHKKVSIERIHMEEDAGKNVHMSDFSLVNLNRACTPLIEIVSGPDMRSAEEAGAYLRGLHAIVTYLGICDGNMQEGNFRCDANVSVMPKGSKVLGTRAEIKNVNSFRFIEKAIEYETARQIEVIKAGGKIVQETRGYDSAKHATFSMRSKEEAQDYRYFPEPDLIQVRLDPKWIEEIKGTLPELPEQKRKRYTDTYGLSSYDAGVLTGSKPMAEFFEASLELLKKSGDLKATAKLTSNWITGEIARLLNEQAIELKDSKLTPRHVADIVGAVQGGDLSSTGAKQVLGVVWQSGDSVNAIIEREGLKQVSDLSALIPAIEKVIADHPGQVQEFLGGKEKLIGFFVGQVMKATGGKANPGMLQELILKTIKKQ